jgi:two-component system, cell cycle sensor histidine kinase and response regulator CckA
MKMGTILVLDDDEMIGIAVTAMLKSLGYAAVCVSTGQEAIRCFKEQSGRAGRIDGLIFDLTVPNGQGGRETIDEIRKLDATVPVFVSSGYADDPVMTHPAEYGFTASLIKPFTLAELAGILDRYVARPK